ncbi:MAG: hypothetical protein VYD19_08730, partial [Myxococcota bacterium]|nr:hypothetical protein [Myxococcota bacterium]
SLIRARLSCVWPSLFILFIAPFSLSAQERSTAGLEVRVAPGQVSLVELALPAPQSLNGEADTSGTGALIHETLTHALNLSGYFNLLETELYPSEAAAEGMETAFVPWSNSGAQGLVKIGWQTLSGGQVQLDLRLFNVDQQKRVSITGFSEPVRSSADELRQQALKFADELVRYYTGKAGFFGSQIAAVQQVNGRKRVVLISADGGAVSPVTRRGRLNLLPHFSRGRVYFTSYRNGGAHLFLYERGQLSSISARSGLNMGASLHPREDKIALALSHEGSSDIYLLKGKSGEIIRRLTRSRSIDISPTWSPNGEQIAFVSDREGTPQVWLMRADGSGQRRFTFQGKYNQSPRWSPDGKWIVFTGRDEKYVFDIFKISVETGEITRLTQNQGNNDGPSWSPDGRHIVFVSSRGGRSELYIMTSDGRSQRSLGSKSRGLKTPSWGR